MSDEQAITRRLAELYADLVEQRTSTRKIATMLAECEAERNAYKAKWESVPWEQINAMRMALAQVFRDKLVQWPSTQRAMFDVEKWLGENMPKEAAE